MKSETKRYKNQREISSKCTLTHYEFINNTKLSTTTEDEECHLKICMLPITSHRIFGKNTEDVLRN